MSAFELNANVVDVIVGRVFPGTVTVADGHIAAIRETTDKVDGFILPGFVDAHVHVESSMMVPSEFARFASVHGTVATVSDPHEIANVLGAEGIQLMVENGRRAPLQSHLLATARVPGTALPTPRAR